MKFKPRAVCGQNQSPWGPCEPGDKNSPPSEAWGRVTVSPATNRGSAASSHPRGRQPPLLRGEQHPLTPRMPSVSSSEDGADGAHARVTDTDVRVPREPSSPVPAAPWPMKEKDLEVMKRSRRRTNYLPLRLVPTLYRTRPGGWEVTSAAQRGLQPPVSPAKPPGTSHWPFFSALLILTGTLPQEVGNTN